MDTAKIYIKGKAGFKPAVRQRIADIWKRHGSEVDGDTIMVLVPAEFQLKSFKSSIGEEVIKTFELQFLTILSEEDTAIANGFFPMPSWSSKESDDDNDNEMRQLPQRDPLTIVF